MFGKQFFSLEFLLGDDPQKLLDSIKLYFEEKLHGIGTGQIHRQQERAHRQADRCTVGNDKGRRGSQIITCVTAMFLVACVCACFARLARRRGSEAAERD